MIGITKQLQVVWAVVFFVLVLVVDDLARQKDSPDLVLHQDTVKRVEPLCISPWVRWICSAVAITSALARRQDFKQTFHHSNLPEGLGRPQAVCAALGFFVAPGDKRKNAVFPRPRGQRNTALVVPFAASRLSLLGRELHDLADRCDLAVLQLQDNSDFAVPVLGRGQLEPSLQYRHRIVKRRRRIGGFCAV